MLPRKILKVKTKICAVWGILEANLKKYSTLKFIMNISCLTSICIHRSIISIFIGKKVCISIFFPTENTFFHDFISARILVSTTKLASIKIIWSKLEPKEQSNKMLIYWSVPDRLVTPGTESLTRHIDLLDAVTHTHLRLVNLAKRKPVSTFSFTSFSHLQNFHFVFHGCADFRHKCFLAFYKYDTKGWDLRPGGGLPFGSSLSKWLSSICKFAEHCWYAYKMAANQPTIPKRLTCKWRLGYFPSLQTRLNHVLTDGGQSKTDLRHLRMCRVRTRSKHEASSQNLTRKTSHMLNIPYNFLNGFELISKMTRGTSQSAEIRRSAEKSHVCLSSNSLAEFVSAFYSTRKLHT